MHSLEKNCSALNGICAFILKFNRFPAWMDSLCSAAQLLASNMLELFSVPMNFIQLFCFTPKSVTFRIYDLQQCIALRWI